MDTFQIFKNFNKIYVLLPSQSFPFGSFFPYLEFFFFLNSLALIFSIKNGRLF